MKVLSSTGQRNNPELPATFDTRDRYRSLRIAWTTLTPKARETRSKRRNSPRATSATHTLPQRITCKVSKPLGIMVNESWPETLAGINSPARLSPIIPEASTPQTDKYEKARGTNLFGWRPSVTRRRASYDPENVWKYGGNCAGSLSRSNKLSAEDARNNRWNSKHHRTAAIDRLDLSSWYRRSRPVVLVDHDSPMKNPYHSRYRSHARSTSRNIGARWSLERRASVTIARNRCGGGISGSRRVSRRARTVQSTWHRLQGSHEDCDEQDQPRHVDPRSLRVVLPVRSAPGPP